jgi:predicted phosphodiesterase
VSKELVAIQVASDLHLHRNKTFDFESSDSDILILAGDIMTGTRGIEFAETLAYQHNKPVIYIAGNHEYYMHNYTQLQESLRVQAGKSQNVHFLNNDVFYYQDIRFVGSTLWTDYKLDGRFEQQDVMQYVGNVLNDHRYISFGTEGLFTTQHALMLHDISRNFLREELNKRWDGKTVVITHHAPSLKCAHPNFQMDHVAGAFISDCEDLIELADVWIFGHTHANVDFHIGKCRVVSNQLGYENERVPVAFRPDLIIEV